MTDGSDLNIKPSRSASGSGNIIRPGQSTGISDLTVELRGNSKVGTVIHLRQRHWLPGLEITEKNTDEFLRVVNNQHQIWRELETRGIKHVFIEGIASDDKVSIAMRDPIGKKAIEVIRSIFPNGLPATLNPEQKLFLGKIGAGRVYTYLHPDVTMHKLLTPKEGKELEALGDKECKQQVEDIKKRVMSTSMTDDQIKAEIDRQFKDSRSVNLHDKYAAREVMAFLKNNPGRVVALIYGAGHDFSNDFAAIPDHPWLLSVPDPTQK